ncbi:MAG TPA: 3-deoxy-D-manno-octulosonic acid transferase [Firmicutes bacterium]|nr:3-deoxy-D-manno-octulosonic acid transferase [Bacillota bacterium]
MAVLFVLYNILFIPVLLVLFPYYFLRALLTGKDRHGLFQRIGLIPRKVFRHQQPVWFHTVSAGEVKASVPVIEEFIKEYPVTVSVGTYTGYKMVREHFGQAVDLFYLPVDFFPFVAGLFKKMAPRILVIVETEIWPQLIRWASFKKVPVMLINGRIPPKDYNSYRLFRGLWKKVFALYEALLVQSETEKQRFIRCGAPEELIQVFGNTKYDVYLNKKDDERSRRLEALFQKRPAKPVTVIGSTHRGEEEILFSRFHQLTEKTLFVLAPRHLDRLNEVEELLKNMGYSVERRSGSLSWDKDVILWDTMGELDMVYRYADLVLVGGSWIPQGGHNFIEPALWEKPILVGPHMHNFQEIFDYFMSEQALLTVGKTEIAEVLVRLISHPDEARQLAERAGRCVRANSGAALRYAEVIKKALDS